MPISHGRPIMHHSPARSLDPLHCKRIMLEITWKEVDRFLLEALGGDDEVLTEAVQRSHAAGLPSIQVATLHARFLMLLARLCGARRILEIGTLGGYSTIHLARALPNDGELITLELKPEHADV